MIANAGDANKTKFIIRLVIGAWSISTFILTDIYNNLLISYATSPNPQPLLNSIYDLVDHPEIHVGVDAGFEYYVDPKVSYKSFQII